MRFAHQLVLLFILGFSSLASAQISGFGDEGITIGGDSVSRDYETKSVIVEGNVEIGMGDQRLSCDKAIVNLKNSQIIASGNVLLVSPTTTIQGSKITYNYKTKLGKIENGFVESGQVVFEGKRVEKTGENSYIAEEAQFTSCTTCPAAWSFSGSKIDAEVGGYAYINYPVLRIADFPVFILPKILIPLKSTRQSGLLVPEFKYSKKGGAAIGESFFWAISPSQDATITMTNFSNRGLKSHVEYRYMLGENSYGKLQTAYLRDRAFTEDGQDAPGTTENILYRKFAHYEHYYELPDNMIHRFNINAASDLRYPRDFNKEMAGHGDPALENSMSLTQNSETHHRSIEATYYINLLQQDADSSNDNAVHRFPEINYNITQQEIGKTGFYYTFDFNYVNFARKGFAYDDVAPVYDPTTGVSEARTVTGTHDGYDPDTDIIRTGQRFIFSPALSYPFHIGKFFDINPTIAYNEAQYRFGASPDAGSTCPTGESCNSSAERKFIQADISVRTKAGYVFGKDDGVSNRYKHEIVPEVVYSTIPWSQRPNHTFFGDFEGQPYSRSAEEVTNNDFYSAASKIQYDYRDRLFDKRLATFILTNNLIRKKNTGEVASYHQLARVRLKQSYDFNEVGRENARPWSPINGLLDIRGDRFETHTVGDYYPYLQVTNWSTRLRFMTVMNNFLELTYAREIYVDQVLNKTEPGQKTEYYGAGLGWKSAYVDVVGKAKYSAITWKLEGWEYATIIKPPGDCWTIKFGQSQSVGADVEYELGLNFLFGGGV